MDGTEIAAATMCGTNNCFTCEYPKTEVDNTEDNYQLGHNESVRKKVEQARAEHLNAESSLMEQSRITTRRGYAVLYVYYMK